MNFQIPDLFYMGIILDLFLTYHVHFERGNARVVLLINAAVRTLLNSPLNRFRTSERVLYLVI